MTGGVVCLVTRHSPLVTPEVSALFDLASCIIRVCNADGETMGTGFVVSDSLAVTCAHVVAACGVALGGNVRVVFHANGEACEAEMLPESWRAPDADDVAVLRLLPQGALLPDGVVPAKLGMTRACNGHAMRMVGFAAPAGYAFDFVEGKILGIASHRGKQQMLRLDAKQHLPTRKEAEQKGIRVGMSGAPVFDLDTQRVVGMYSEFLEETPLEWATTSETLAAICPELKLHPPQAVEDYLAAVREYCANLPYLTLHDIRPPKTLNEVYVPLKARPQVTSDERRVTGDEKEPRVTRHIARPELAEGSHVTLPLSIAEVLQNPAHAHLLILGEPGAGKSTLLRQLAEHAWDAPQRVGLATPHLPLLVPLRQLAQADGSLEERLGRALTNEMALLRELPEGFFDEWTRQTDACWLILLDGLDEVPADQRADLMRRLASVLKEIGQNRIVITARPSGYARGELDEEQFGHYELLSFTPEQTGEFARNWFREQSDAFLQELERVRAGALSGTPLLLTIAAKVFLERHALPVRRSALYEQFVDIWLKEAEVRGLKSELGERVAKVAKFALARLALAMTERTSVIPEAELFQVAAGYLRESLHLSEDEAEADGEKFVQVMARRSGVFVRRGDVYDWIHPTFREYLTADAIVRECRQDPECVWKRTVSRWAEENWREVALFVLSIMSDYRHDVTDLVMRVQDDEDGLYLAAETLVEQLNVTDDLRQVVVNNLTERARKMSDLALYFGPNPVSTLEYLHGDPSVINRLLTLVLEEEVNIWVRLRIVEILGRLRRTNDLVALLCDERVNQHLRVRIAELLAKLQQANKTVPILLSSALDQNIDEEVRSRAAEVLTDLGFRNKALQAWLALARDKHVNRWTREKAIEKMRRLEWADGLLEFASDELMDWQLRELAIQNIGSLGWIDGLLKLAGDKKSNWLVRELALAHLGRMGMVEKAASIWLVLSRDRTVPLNVRIGAIDALKNLGRVDDLLPLAQNNKERVVVRISAAKAAGELGRTGKVVPILVDLATEARTSGELRVRAAEALGELGQIDQVAPMLLALARNRQAIEEVRMRAIEALLKLGRVGDLLELVHDNELSWNVRERAAEILQERGLLEQALHAWLALMHDVTSKAEMRVQAAEVVARLGKTDEAAAVLLVLAQDDRAEAQARVKASIALDKLGYVEEGSAILLALARDGGMKARIRRIAAEALGRLGRGDDLLTLARGEGVDTRVSKKAVEALVDKLGGDDDLLALAHDERVEALVRLRAAEALSKLGRIDESVTILLTLARDERADARVRVRAAKVLGESGRVEGATILLMLAQDHRVETRMRVRAALESGILGYVDEGAVILLPLAQGKRVAAPVRVRAAEALGKLGRVDESATILLELAQDERVGAKVRKRAAKALGRFGDARVLPHLERIGCEDADKKVQRAAWRAIEEIRRRTTSSG